MPTSWSDWSDWAADQCQNLLYRVRQDHQGNLDYEYSHDYEMCADTPRGSLEMMEALTPGIDGLSPGSNLDFQEYELHSGPKERPIISDSKGVEGEDENGREERGGDERERETTGDKEKVRRNGKVKDKNKYKNKDGWRRYQDDKSSQRKGHSHYLLTQPKDKVQANIDGTEVQGQTDYAHHARHYTTSEYLEPEAAYANFAPEEEEFTTPEDGALSDDEDQFEEIDPRYRIEHSSRFQPGEIFKVYWCEPLGSGEYKHASVSRKGDVQTRFGIKFFVGFRRFIVIANDQGHCTCVPILTYGGKACTKNGVKPSKHGIIHEYGYKARMLDGEPKLGFPAVQARITEHGERLSRESRVNYSKLVTVEHNVNVFFIGSVATESWPQVVDAVNDCWYQKVHQRRRS
ncbi:hypothetical protein E4U21_002784 [Claviceps maximensis]|nr:hypothetical protein E4U21_002784 [Claviceps maximensis]